MDLAKRKSLVGPIKSDSGAMRKVKKAAGAGLENRRGVRGRDCIKFFKNAAKGSRKMKVVRLGIFFFKESKYQNMFI